MGYFRGICIYARVRTIFRIDSTVCALIVSEIYDFRECARARAPEPVPNNACSLVKYSTNSNALHLRVMDLTVLSRIIRTLSRRRALSCPHDVTLVSTRRIFIESETYE